MWSLGWLLFNFLLNSTSKCNSWECDGETVLPGAREHLTIFSDHFAKEKRGRDIPELAQSWYIRATWERSYSIKINTCQYFQLLLSSHGNFAPGYLNFDSKCLNQPLQTQLDDRPQQDFESLPIQEWTLLIWSYKITWINRCKSSLRILPTVKMTLRKVNSLESGLIRPKSPPGHCDVTGAIHAAPVSQSARGAICLARCPWHQLLAGVSGGCLPLQSQRQLQGHLAGWARI